MSISVGKIPKRLSESYLMSIRTLSSRIRRLEQKSGSSSLAEYYAGLSDEELEADITASKLPLHKQSRALANLLGWTVSRAQAEIDGKMRLAEHSFLGWSDNRIREFLEDACSRHEGMREQFAIWLEEP